MKKQNLRKMVKAITLSLLVGTALSVAQPAWAADTITYLYDGTGGQSYKSKMAADAKGDYSFAFGNKAEANGNYSVALGNSSKASGKSSITLGYKTMAEGDYSVALGLYAVAKGYGAVSLTGYSYANGKYSIAMGNSTISNGADSTAMGRQTLADGLQSLASGYSSHALGNGSFAGGGYWVSDGDHLEGGKAYGKNSFAFGENAVTGTYATKTLAEADVTGEGAYNREYQIGDVLLVDGNVKILQGDDFNVEKGGTYSGKTFQANDVVVVSSGANAVAIGQGAHAIYDNSVAIGQYAVVSAAATVTDVDGTHKTVTNEFAVGGGKNTVEGVEYTYLSRITGVADGTSDHDAATYGQVKNAVNSLSYDTSTKKITYTTVSNSTAVELVDLSGFGGGEGDEKKKIYVVPKPESAGDEYELGSYGIDINYEKEESGTDPAVVLNGYGLTVYEPPKPIESNGLLTITASSPMAEYKYNGVHISDSVETDAILLGAGLTVGTDTGNGLVVKGLDSNADVYVGSMETDSATNTGLQVTTTDKGSVFAGAYTGGVGVVVDDTNGIAAMDGYHFQLKKNTSSAELQLGGLFVTNGTTTVNFGVNGISAGGQKITNVANGSENTDAATYGQIITGVTYSGSTLTLTKGDGTTFTATISGGSTGGGGDSVFGTEHEITVTPGTGDDAGKKFIGLADEVKTDISTLKTAVGDVDSGLVKDVADLQTTVGNSSSGLVHDVTALQTTVGNSSSGLVKNVADIQKYVKESGLDANGKKITNVADGTEASDAVNYGQLQEALGSTGTGEAFTELKDQVGNMAGQIDRLGTRINKVGAGAVALAAMHPVYDEDSKLTFSAGLGSYRNEQAAAVGMFFRFSPRVMMNAGATVGNDNNMYNVGLNFALDRHVRGGLPSKAVMAKQLSAMSEENVQLKNKVANMEEQMIKMLAMIEELKNR